MSCLKILENLCSDLPTGMYLVIHLCAFLFCFVLAAVVASLAKKKNNNNSTLLKQKSPFYGFNYLQDLFFSSCSSVCLYNIFSHLENEIVKTVSTFMIVQNGIY